MGKNGKEWDGTERNEIFLDGVERMGKKGKEWNRIERYGNP